MENREEELKDRFIVDEKFDKKKVEKFVERLLPFCKVTKTGAILLERDDFTSTEKIKIALVARFLANSLDESISAEVNSEELSNNLMIPKNQVVARLKELKDERFAFRVSRGIYKVNPLKINDFLNNIESKYI